MQNTVKAIKEWQGIAVIATVLVSAGSLIWRGSHMHAEAMSRIDMNTQSIVKLSDEIDHATDSYMTRTEFERVMTGHENAPHADAISRRELEFLREDISEVKGELLRMREAIEARGG